MSENELDFTKAEKRILINYKKIHKFIYKYSIFLIITFIAIILVYIQSNKNIKLNIVDNFVVEKAKLIWAFEKTINQDTDDKYTNIYILQWSLKISDDLLFSTNNLLSYKDLIMPNTIFANNLKDIKNKKYFESWDYKIKDLESFAKNILFTNSDQAKADSKQIINLPIETNIQDTFYLQCIHDTKIFNKICDYYIQNFIEDFYIYDISKDYKWLIDIFDQIKNTKHKDQMCKAMNKYILYSNDTNKKLENIFIACWDDYYKNFHTLELFLDILNQLQKWYINTTVYQNKLLNDYKLISYQQLIYNDIRQNKVNNIRFETYISFLQEILKSNDKIDWFYIDISYWLNNNYLINILNKLKYKVSDKKKWEIENIIDWLNRLNNWDELVWYAWLKNQLINKDLEKNNKLDEELNINFEQQDAINKLLNWVKDLSFFKIIDNKISWEKIKISWYFSIKDQDWIKSIYTSIITENKNDELIINKINFDGYKELNDIIWEVIKSKQYTIPEIYQYLQDNINIFLSDDKISTCELIWNTIKNWLWWIELMECNPDSVSILKTTAWNNENKNNKTYYRMTMDNFNITDIMISDKTLENELSKSLTNINTNNITISKIIEQIISYEPKQKEYIQQWSNNIIITLEDFEKYLSIIPSDIVEWQNKIIAEFSVNNIKFICNYNIENKKIWPLYFKYDISNSISKNTQITKEDLAINDFELYLDETHQNDINEFLIDPLKYIKTINPNAVNNYKSITNK